MIGSPANDPTPDRQFDMPHLVRLDGATPPLVPLRDGVTRIGRSSRNDLQLKESSVSRFQCCLVREGPVVRVYDAQSSNPTRIGEARADGQALRDGDTLTLGRMKLLFRDPSGAASATTPPPAVPTVAAPPAVPKAAAPPAVAAPGRARRRAASAAATVRWRARSWSTALPLAALLLGFSVACGWIIYAGAFGDSAGRAPATVASAAPAAARADELRDVIRSQDRRIAELTQLLERSLAARGGASAPRDDAAHDAAQDAAGAGAGESDDAHDARLDAIGDELRRLEEDRRRMARALGDALLGIDEPAIAAPSGGAEPEWQTSVRQPDGVPETSVAEARRVPVERPTRVLSTSEIHGLTEAVKEGIGRFAEVDVQSSVLEPALGDLSHGEGARPAAAVLELIAYCDELLTDLDRTVSFLERRNDEYRRRARELGGASGEGSLSKPYGSAPKSPALETAQRELELSQKKIDIQRKHRIQLAALRGVIVSALEVFRDEGALELLTSRFALSSNDKERLVLARVLEVGRVRRAAPYLIARLGDRNQDLRDASRRALVAIAGVDHGKDRKDWDAWWQSQETSVEGR